MTLNLVQDRGGSNVWDRIGSRRIDTERWLAALGATGLLVAGATRPRTRGGLFLLACGTACAIWAATSAHVRSRSRGQMRIITRFGRHDDEAVTEASEESFPASDPPAITPSH